MYKPPQRYREFYNYHQVPNGFTGVAYLTSHYEYVCYKNGEIHCLDGPAVVSVDRHGKLKNSFHYINGELIRSIYVYENNKLVIAYKEEKLLNSILDL